MRASLEGTEKEEMKRRFRDGADYWNSMCSAVTLTDGAGLQPFTVPSGWMGSSSPPPTQAYSPDELASETERNEPVLDALLDAVIDRAPSLCRKSSLMPLARLACWTESEKWVRPLDEWPGEEQLEPSAAAAEVDPAAAADQAEVEAAAEAANAATEAANAATARVEAAEAAVSEDGGEGQVEALIELRSDASNLRQKAAQLRYQAARTLAAAQRNADARAEAAARPLEAAALRSLACHLLEKWEVPEALHGALTLCDGPPVTEATHRIARAFVRVHAAAGSGEASVLAMLRSEVSPVVTKAAAKAFVKLSAHEAAAADAADAAAAADGASGDGAVPSVESALLHPLHALRRAQALSVGGEAWVAKAACDSQLGTAMLPNDDEGGGTSEGGGSEGDGTGPTEAYALSCVDWIVRRAVARTRDTRRGA
jgi:hypothetical protein